MFFDWLLFILKIVCSRKKDKVVFTITLAMNAEKKRKRADIAADIRKLARTSIECFQKKTDVPRALLFDGKASQVIKTGVFMVSAVQEQLRYTSLPPFVDTTDNFNVQTMQFIEANADEIAKSVHERTSSFVLTPGQMVAIHYVAYGSQTTVAYGYTMRKEAVLAANIVKPNRGKPGNTVNLKDCNGVLSLKPESMPSKLRVVCFPPGTGKTIITVAAMQLVLFSEKGQRQSFKFYKHCASDPETGYRRENTSDFESMAKRRIAPLVLFFVPKNMMEHWRKTVADSQAECTRLFGEGVRVWQGLKKEFSVDAVFQDMLKTFWILPLESKSLDVMQEHPDVAVSGVVYDEMNTNISKNGARARSPIAGPVLVPQATVETLKLHFRNKTSGNFLQNIVGAGALNTAQELKCLVANKQFTEVRTSLISMAKLRLSMPPETLMTMLASGSVSKMPEGVVVLRLRGRPTLLQTMHPGSLTFDLSACFQQHFSLTDGNGLLPTAAFIKSRDDDVIQIDWYAMDTAFREYKDRVYKHSIFEDHYAELGVPGYADEDEIKKAFHQQALKWHPDKNNGCPEAAERFKKIKRAYDVLSDDVGRQYYDRTSGHEYHYEKMMNNNKTRMARAAGTRFEEQKAKIHAFLAPCSACHGAPVFLRCNNLAVCDNPLCEKFYGVARFAMQSRMPLGASVREKVSKLQDAIAPEFTSQELVYASLSFMITENPKASVLLFCKQMTPEFEQFMNGRHGRLGNTKIVDLERTASAAGKAKKVFEEFISPTRENAMILVCSLSKGSGTVAGLDLKTTTGVVIFGSMSTDQQTQIYGRVLRMDVEGKGMIPVVVVS